MITALPLTTGKDNPMLRQQAKSANITPELLALIDNMILTMKTSDGIGLAAPQVGQSIQMFVVDPLAFDKERSKWEFKKITPPDLTQPLAFINPVISSYPKGDEKFIEGCLSLPHWEGLVSRAKRVTIKAQLVTGETFKLQAKGLLARVLQHEYDHLQGTLICDKWEKEKKITRQRVRGIVFFGDSEYSKIVLEVLKGTPYEPEIVIGKSYKLQAISYKLGITASYGHIIPQEVINKFKHGILNIHPSLLPEYRGSSPLQASILHGDKKTGVSVMQLVQKMDAGPLLARGELVMNDERFTAQELGVILFKEGAKMLLRMLPEYLAGQITPVAQKEEHASYTSLIKKEDALIDWRQDAIIIERQIRAYQPWPVAYTLFVHRGQPKRLQLLEAAIAKNLTGHHVAGNLETVDKQLIVHCGKGALLIHRLRPEGKKEMSGEEFLRGYDAQTFFD